SEPVSMPARVLDTDGHLRRGAPSPLPPRASRVLLAPMPKRSAAVAKRKRPKQERSHAMVETIIEAAARVFVELGYARASTNRIAQAAGVSVGSLYQYFPGKDAIAVELARRLRASRLELVTSRLRAASEEPLETVV